METPKVLMALLAALVIMAAVQAIEVAMLVNTISSGSFAANGGSALNALPAQVGGCG